jgi:pyridinium-3,5-bisthiocarboxylic acid mononucleotide nickel chelatase
MKTLYLDLSSGISGDMFVAALIDLGVEASQLEQVLGKLPLDGYHLHVKRGHKGSLEGVKFDVHLSGDHHHGAHSHSHAHAHDHSHGHSHDHPHEHGHDSSERGGEHGRDFAQIRQLITESLLSDWVKQKAMAVFQRLAVAEGRIHGLPPEQVSFHEVGAVDSIVDIVGACIALEMLGKPRVLASPVVEGTGWVDCAHGRLPIPAPATLAILGARGIALSQCEEPNELVTPTGAALLAEFVEGFGPMRKLVAEKIGYGLGTRDNPRRPNALRAILGEERGEGRGARGGAVAHDWETDTVAVLETNLDDINAEILGHFVETALAAGALDVFHTAIQMKKNRPGVLLTVLCAEDDADKFCELLVRETSTFGIRRYSAERRKLHREFITLKTAHGSLSVKLGKLDGQVLQAAPEFESCKKLAEQAGVPIKEVYDAALRAVPPSLK